MAHCRHLPIWKAALDLAVHLEHAVRGFPIDSTPPPFESLSHETPVAKHF